MSAKEQVLGLPELFERILLNLSTLELLLAQGVDHHFHNTIQDTPSLRQKLFLEPMRTNRPLEEVRLEVNPLIVTTELEGPAGNDNDAPRIDLLIKDEFLVVKAFPCRVGGRTPTYVHGSWRKMYLIQPPIEAYIHFHHTGGGNSAMYTFTSGFLGYAKVPAGSTMESIVRDSMYQGVFGRGPIMHMPDADCPNECRIKRGAMQERMLQDRGYGSPSY